MIDVGISRAKTKEKHSDESGQCRYYVHSCRRRAFSVGFGFDLFQPADMFSGPLAPLFDARSTAGELCVLLVP